MICFFHPHKKDKNCPPLQLENIGRFIELTYKHEAYCFSLTINSDSESGSTGLLAVCLDVS